MTSTLVASCIQTTATENMGENLHAMAMALQEAKRQGAAFALLPEAAGFLHADSEKLRDLALPEHRDPVLSGLRQEAKRLGLWVLIGSLLIREESASGRILNRSYLVDPDGEVRASYDKIHLFDADLPNGERYRESDLVCGGNRACLARTPWGPLGMSICYDVRFADLFRRYAQAGAALIGIPAAFTRPSGKAHWHTLVRARAIETGAFVLAPAQCGMHTGGRTTYGHSLIVSPWGEILAEAGEEPAVITAELDLSLVEKSRSSLPAWRTDFSYSLDQVA